MNRCYCDNECPKGKMASEDFLSKSNSAFDAAIDFISFTEECFKTCPFVDQHKEDEGAVKL